MGRRIRRGAIGTAAAIVLLPILYFLGVLIGGLFPANAGWTPPAAGIPVFIRTNGVHTWIMVPTANAEMDWRPLAPIGDVRDPTGADDYIAIGFGNRAFYLETPTWADLSLATALKAGLGIGSGLVHVEHEPVPRVDRDHRMILMRPEEYRRLAQFIAASFVIREGRTVPLSGRGYAAHDIFYEGEGAYDAIRTCNEWTGAALRHAGVRTGAWTPLEWSVMRWLTPS